MAKRKCITDVVNDVIEKNKNSGLGFDRIAVEQKIIDFANEMENAVKQGKKTIEEASRIIKNRTISTLFGQSKLSTQHWFSFGREILAGREWAAKGEGRTEVEYYMASLGGKNLDIEGARNSVGSRQKARNDWFYGHYYVELNKAGVWDSVVNSNDKFDLLLGKELRNLSDGNKKQLTESTEAFKAAKVIHNLQNVVVDMLNRLGAFIDKRLDYIVKQSHERSRILGKKPRGLKSSGDIEKWLAESKQEWKNFLLPRLNRDKSFGSLDDTVAHEFLDKMFDNIENRSFYNVGSDLPSVYESGFKNIAKNVSKKRALHFNDAAGAVQYNKKYGSGSIHQSIIDGFTKAADNIGLMEVLGPNPELHHKQRMDYFNNIKNKDIYLKKDLSGLKVRKLNNMFKEVTNEVNMTESDVLANFGKIARTLNNMTALGSATLSAFADVPLLSAELNYQGINCLAAYGKTFEASMNLLGTQKEKLEFARLLGVGLEGLQGNFMSKFADDSILTGKGFMGWAGKQQERFFRATLLQHWTDSHKVGLTLIMSNRLAGLKNQTWKQLRSNKGNKQLTEVLKLYNIGEKDWDIIRNSKMEIMNGREYFKPDSIRKINHVLAENLDTYFKDRVDFGVITPGKREASVMHYGTKRGTVLGELVRMFMQFKSFPLTILMKPANRMALGKNLEGYGAGMIVKGALKHSPQILLQMVIPMTIAGYFSDMAHDVVMGKKPKGWGMYDDIINGKGDLDRFGKVWLSAFKRGGSAGLVGEFITNTNVGWGRSIGSSLLGPGWAKADALLNLTLGAGSSESKSRQAFYFFKSNIPYINLWYTKLAINQTLMFGIQDAMNRKYTRNLEKRRKKEWGTDYWLDPTDRFKPY